jgi:ATP-dependent DNA helicase RecQ
VHGIGQELEREQWRTLLRQLTGLGYLRPVQGGKGGLELGPSELVRPLLRGEAALALPQPPPRQERGQRTGRGNRAGGAEGISSMAGVDEELLKALRNWRREQAQLQGVPPYVVFHDRTLLELAAKKPLESEGLGRVSGIGAAKLERYGEALLTVLRRWT